MKKYNEQNQLILMQCNCCKKELQIKNGIVEEGCFSVDQSWGYFSNKDGQCHEFDLCESCYDEMIAKMRIPVLIREKNELL